MRKTYLLICFVVVSISIDAQLVSDFSGLKDKYKENDIYGVLQKEEVIISLNKGELDIKEKVFHENYYLNYKAGIYLDDDVYESVFRKIDEIEAGVFIPKENNKFKKQKVKNFVKNEMLDNDVFYNGTKSISFNYTGLTEGAISYLKYSMKVSEPKYVNRFIFQHYFPVEVFDYTVEVDRAIDIEIKYINCDSTDVNFTKTLKGNKLIYNWTVKNVEDYKDESADLNFFYHIPHVIIYIKGYRYNDEYINVLNTPNDLLDWYSQLIAKVDQTILEEMDSVARSVVETDDPDDLKVKKMFKWVQDNIKYIAIEDGLAGFQPENPKDVFKKRYGDCKGMSVLLHAMLKVVGVETYYTWVGTDKIPYKYSEFATPLNDNHFILTYKSGQNYYYLDATNSHISSKIHTDFIQGQEVLIRITDEEYEIKTVPVFPAEANQVIDTAKIIIEDNIIKGSAHAVFTGYQNSKVNRMISNIHDEEDKLKRFRGFFEKGNNKFKITNSSHETIDDNRINVNYDFTIEDYIVSVDNEVYVNLNLTKEFPRLELLKEDRKHEIVQPFNTKYVVFCELTIPENYEITYIPQNASFKKSKFYNYSIVYKKENNKILYSFDIVFDKLVLPKENFDEYNEMLKKLRADFKETIVLKKK